MREIINKLKGKIKPLWARFKTWLIKRLGGYTFPPTVPEIKAEKVETVKVSASLMVDKYRYDRDLGYRQAISNKLAGYLGLQILSNDVMSSETMVELNDNEYIVKASATLVKGGQ